MSDSGTSVAFDELMPYSPRITSVTIRAPLLAGLTPSLSPANWPGLVIVRPGPKRLDVFVLVVIDLVRDEADIDSGLPVVDFLDDVQGLIGIDDLDRDAVFLKLIAQYLGSRVEKPALGARGDGDLPGGRVQENRDNQADRHDQRDPGKKAVDIELAVDRCVTHLSDWQLCNLKNAAKEHGQTPRRKNTMHDLRGIIHRWLVIP